MSQSPSDDARAFNRLKDCRHGRMLYNGHDVHVGRSLDLYGEYSEEEVHIFSQVLRPGDVVIEAGANIGAHTIPLARLVGPRGVVAAFEPQRLVFQTLCANAAINSFTNVYCYQAALAESSGWLNIPLTDPYVDQNFGHVEIAGHSKGERAPVLTIDSLPMHSCRLIKLDVEGMELHVLRGASQAVQKFAPVLYVENDRPDREAELIRHIDSLGYVMFWHEPRLFRPGNFFNNPHNVFGTTTSKNMLCVPRGMGPEVEGLLPVIVPPAPGAL